MKNLPTSDNIRILFNVQIRLSSQKRKVSTQCKYDNETKQVTGKSKRSDALK